MFEKVVIIFLSLIVFFSCVYADDGDSFVYDSTGLRDPFVSLINKEGVLKAGYQKVSSIEGLFLQGIIYDPAGVSVAIFNDLMLREDEKIGNVLIKKIEPDMIVVEFDGKEYVLKPKE
ncbi:MAG: hypothetical protein ABIB11_04455 [Candidatus Omnitrophota bacterium]